jgi:hypothetical protein
MFANSTHFKYLELEMTKPVSSRRFCCQVLKMKVTVSLISFVSFTNLATIVYGETVNCKVVPFETQEGLSGTCCVFFKNPTSANATFPKEEVSRQILANKDKEVQTEQGPSGQDTAKNDDEKLLFVSNKDDKSSTVTPVQSKGKGDDKKLVSGQGSQGAKGWSPKMNVTIQNKNAFDTPEMCPQGTLKDHAGGCTEPL